MLTILGHPRKVCDGLTRREILRAAGTGLLGVNLPKVLAAEEQGAGRGKAKSVIFLFLFGGPSQLETFDMKPEAPEKIRGPHKPIPCRTDGLLICEHLPRLAQVSDKFSVVRTMTHDYNDHSGGGHYIQTGHRWQIPMGGGFSATPQDWPSMGSVVEYLNQNGSSAGPSGLPAYAVVPNWLGRLQDAGQYRRPGQYAGWLGRAYNPLTTSIDKRNKDDNPYWRDCTDDELNFQIDGLATFGDLQLDRMRKRVSLLEQFDSGRRTIEGRNVREFNQFRERAIAMVASDKTRTALNVRQEPAKIRDQYGRHLFGQATLMARRLVEAGVRFVTVHYDCCDGYSWDSHVSNDDVEKHLLPTFDQAFSALLTDLDARGMLDETLVVAMGEMGRTPQASARWGRHHWSTLFPAVLAGGGVRRGFLYGASDKDAAFPIEKPVSPEDMAATIYHALGIDPEMRLLDMQGRPVSIVEGGKPVLELFG